MVAGRNVLAELFAMSKQLAPGAGVFAFPHRGQDFPAHVESIFQIALQVKSP